MSHCVRVRARVLLLDEVQCTTTFAVGICPSTPTCRRMAKALLRINVHVRVAYARVY